MSDNAAEPVMTWSVKITEPDDPELQLLQALARVMEIYQECLPPGHNEYGIKRRAAQWFLHRYGGERDGDRSVGTV